jgi:peptidoglycan L-alanyl-D-glutamate endopeptidase CwlK
MREKISLLIARCEAENHPIAINETLRDMDVQAAYCAQGRKPLEEVNALRKAAGLWLIGEEENRNKITDEPPLGLETVYRSRGHGNGTAADVVPLRNGKPWWVAPVSVWEEIGKIGEELGLVWGGRWKTRDFPHFQLPREV